MQRISIDSLLNQVNSYTNKARVREDSIRLMSEYRALLPKIGKLVRNRGQESRLLIFSGTIPIFYKSVQYNIPMDIYITETYPAQPPNLYVRPTANMTVKANHRHVDTQGMVYLPYLHEWNAQSSNLVALCEIASSVFSIEPPLFSRPAGAPPVNNANSVAQPATPSTSIATTAYNPYASNVQSTNTSNTGSTGTNPSTGAAIAASNLSTAATPVTASPYLNYGSGGTGGAAAALPITTATAAGVATAVYAGTGTYSATNVTTAAQPQNPTTVQANTNGNSVVMTSSSNQMTPANEHKRMDLIDRVTMKLYEQIDKKHRVLRDEIDSEFTRSSYLQSSFDNATAEAAALRSSVAAFSDGISILDKKAEELTKWKEDETNKPALTAEERVYPYDDLSKQIAHLIGELHAIDDAFYYMERALVSSQNEMDLSTFLRESRKLARRQFMCKAHLKKIMGVCKASEQQQQLQQMQKAGTMAPLPLQNQQQYQLAQQQQQYFANSSFSQLPPHQIPTAKPTY